jgi:bifunctional oligoribonuclease and PAP phosphatase NrnA
MITTDNLQRTGDLLLAQNRLRLLLHKHPDGDTMGSCTALARFLKKKGKDVEILGPFPHPDKFDFLAGFQEIQDGREEVGNADFEDTLYVVVDSTGVDRTGFAEGDFKRLLRLDHHIGGSNYHEDDLLDTTAAAAALIVCQLLRHMDEDLIDTEIATCLYTGLMTDTGGFRYSSTNERVFRNASFLVERGAVPSEISSLVNDRRSPHYLTLMRRALESLEFHADGRVALLTLTTAGLSEEEIAHFGEDEFIGLPRSLSEVEVVVQMKLIPGSNWKIGFRGKGKVNVQKVAVHFGGGGHFSASGCEMDGDEQELKREVLERVFQELAESESVV